MQGVKLTDLEVMDLLDQYESDIRKLKFLIEQKKQAIAELKSLETLTSSVAKVVKQPAAPAAKATKATKGRRGRPAKQKAETAQNGQTVAESKTPEAKTKPEPATKKRRGRPKKAANATAATAETEPKAKAKAAPKAKAKTTAKPKAKKDSGAAGYRLSDWDQMILEGLEKRQKVMISADLLELGKKKVSDENLGLDEKQIQGKINRSLQKLANKRGVLSKTDYPGKGHAYGLAAWANPDGEIRKKYQH